MSIDDTTPTTLDKAAAEVAAEQVAAEEAAAEQVAAEELTEEQQEAKSVAASMRLEGADRASVVKHMTDVGIDPVAASESVDSIDLMVAIIHKIRPADVSAKVGEQIDEMDLGELEPERKKLTRKPEALMKEATMMAARRQSKDRIVDYLTKHGVTTAEAKKVAARVTMDISAARSTFEESKRSARKTAFFRIGMGALMLIVGLAMMSSGTDTSGSRRSPLGAVLAGIFILGSGITTLVKIEGESFEERVRKAYR